MGVPKFYRWISERYPCLSEVVKEHQVPEFDNLYLDMNGIIHNCSHPNDEDPHFRITEEQIFSDIFHYIEVLFRIIRPRKTFFMAVDGVAPRAKMNQQRGRRFRSAREAEERDEIARSKGEVLPTEKRFDSNCITPGTKFMEKLQTQLEYFVKSKITHDRSWQGVDVYLSGHQTPGEGEHKIMEFIRYQRSQSGYDANTRHCLYGLDADLMMLALCSHEPHFALLREEVRFTKRKNNKKTARAEETTFHLLHISLMREYIDHEFEELKNTLTFPYDLESIIDDWILMGFLVGNDFIPHLPNLHIATNALPLLYRTYIEVLPQLDGYINESGLVNLKRFQSYLEALNDFDEDQFEDIYEDYKWLASRKQANQSTKTSLLLEEEKSVQIVKDLAISQGIYSDNDSQEDASNDDTDPFYREFKQHKRHYYSEKFKVTPSNEQIQCIAFEYILGIQWICHYYFNGVQSWGWYYPYHYSPFVSDLKNVSTMKLKYKMNKPFLPYEQLLAVLPAASKDCIPDAYWNLMDEATSEIGDFYPTAFSTDLNGKKQEWEAVVLIPFIEETRLLDAMEPCGKKLSKEERVRNQHGPCQLYTYDRSAAYHLKSTLPGVFPDIAACCARRKNIPLHSWSKLPISSFVKGLLPDCDLSVYYQGFPTLYHLQHTVSLRKQGVRVFQDSSRNENMILTIQSSDDKDANYASAMQGDETLEETAQRLLGKSVYVNWPHMEEAKVVAVSDGKIKFWLDEQVTGTQGSRHQLKREELIGLDGEQYFTEVASITESALHRRGIEFGETAVLLYAQLLLGCKYVCGKKGEITLEKQWSTTPQPFAIQATVKDLTVKGPTFEKMKSLEDLFPKGAEIFNIGLPHYGSMGKVERIKDGNIVVKLEILKEPDLRMAIEESTRSSTYQPGFKAAKMIGISSYMLSRITGSIYVYYPSQQKWNIGLNLKFTKENCGISGFTKRKDNSWLFSNSLVEVMQLYHQKYPEVFEYLERTLTNNSESNLVAENIFKDEDTLTKLNELTSFLKSLPCANGRKLHESSTMVDGKAVSMINEAVADFKKSGTATSLEMQLGIRPRFLYIPMTHQGSLLPDKHAQHHLMDRIVNVRMGYTVPLGYRGTIIAIHMGSGAEQDIMFDVLFDDEFLGGLTLGGQCPERRGYKLPACAMVNLTHGERLLNRHSHRPVAVVKPHNQEPNFENRSYRQPYPYMANQPNRPQQLIQSPHSAFSPAPMGSYRPTSFYNGTNRNPNASNVHTVKTAIKADDFLSTSSNYHRRQLSQNKPTVNRGHSLLNEAAKRLPKVENTSAASSASTATSVRTVRVASSSGSRVQQKGKLAIQTQVSMDESKSKSQPENSHADSRQPGVEELSAVLKTALKITEKGDNTARASDKQQFDKLISNLKDPSIQSTADVHRAPAKPFSLKEFLASNPAPTYDGMYPMYTCKPTLLRPDSFQSTTESVAAETQPKKEGAEKLWELLNINEDEKLKDSSAPSWSSNKNDVKAEVPLQQENDSSLDEQSNPEEKDSDDIKETNTSISSTPKESAVKKPIILPVDKLLQWCQLHKMPSPVYTYSNAHLRPGQLVCTLRLWNGCSFSSSALATRKDAMQEAAIRALAYVDANHQQNTFVGTSIPLQFPTTTGTPLAFTQSVRDTNLPPFNRPFGDRKCVIPAPPYVMGPPPPVPPQFPMTQMPPPPVNLFPLAPEGMMMYPPPPMFPYPYQHLPPPYVASSFVHPSIAQSTKPYSVMSSNANPCFQGPHTALNPDSYNGGGRIIASNIPFIPSQVMSQHYAAKATNNIQLPSEVVINTPVKPILIPVSLPQTSSASAGDDSTKKRKSKRGTLAINFAPSTPK